MAGVDNDNVALAFLTPASLRLPVGVSSVPLKDRSCNSRADSVFVPLASSSLSVNENIDGRGPPPFFIDGEDDDPRDPRRCCCAPGTPLGFCRTAALSCFFSTSCCMMLLLVRSASSSLFWFCPCCLNGMGLCSISLMLRKFELSDCRRPNSILSAASCSGDLFTLTILLMVEILLGDGAFPGAGRTAAAEVLPLARFGGELGLGLPAPPPASTGAGAVAPAGAAPPPVEFDLELERRALARAFPPPARDGRNWTCSVTRSVVDEGRGRTTSLVEVALRGSAAASEDRGCAAESGLLASVSRCEGPSEEDRRAFSRPEAGSATSGI
mmetsp:Transcript_14389/g.35928  ORF Transcript_14389/g.35928 Transcript_14389/m.35928 type:complete len:326 (-) Transcript_14389:234-1211(-)